MTYRYRPPLPADGAAVGDWADRVPPRQPVRESRIERQKRRERMLAADHYRPRSVYHPRIAAGCPECARLLLTFTHALSARWHKPPTVRWARMRARILAEQPLCYCGAPAVDIDHKLARNDGGSNTQSNLHGLCKRCHGEKTAVEVKQRLIHHRQSLKANLRAEQERQCPRLL